MKILYVGSEKGTSSHRANALRRLGHEVLLIDPGKFIQQIPLAGVWHRYLGAVWLVSRVRSGILQRVRGSKFDLIWVDSGGLVARALVEDLKEIAPRVINYNIDDPYGRRDCNAWTQYRLAVRAYDLVVVVREENIEEAKALKARRVIRVYRSADEVAHANRELTEEERAKWKSEVVFVGTGFPERGAFFCDLIRHGVPLSIYGSKWNELNEWKTLKRCWKGSGLEDSHSYSTAILAAKVSLGLLSKGNRDLHTTRSLEIPSLGGVLCAERTSEHLNLYREDEEAVFWGNAEECAAKCKALLANEPLRRSVAVRGHERYVKNGWTNMKVAEMILHAAFE
jgi:spore maturation protein CgeB